MQINRKLVFNGLLPSALGYIRFSTAIFSGTCRSGLRPGGHGDRDVEYESTTSLPNTRNDAEALAETLSDIGFDVTLGIDLNETELRAMMDDFSFRSETADLALIYFAGHGIQVQGENFLIPIDAKPRTNFDVQQQSVSLKEMLDVVAKARLMRIIILDSCRDNPLGGAIDPDTVVQSESQALDQTTRGVGGLAPADPDRGTLVAFAAKDGEVALDGTRGNSPYARALMDKMSQPGLEISLMFRQVRDAVLEETGNLQEPYTYGSLTGTPFYSTGTPSGEPALTSSEPSETWSRLRARSGIAAACPCRSRRHAVHVGSRVHSFEPRR